MKSQNANKEGPRRIGRPFGPRPDATRIAVVRQRLYASGQTIADWSAENGETPMQVSKVLSGKRACMTGEAHRIAVKLGIKDGVIAPAACE